jgi:hypothetical protein
MYRPSDPLTADALAMLRELSLWPRGRALVTGVEAARLVALVDALSDPRALFVDELGIPQEPTISRRNDPAITKRKLANRV